MNTFFLVFGIPIVLAGVGMISPHNTLNTNLACLGVTLLGAWVMAWRWDALTPNWRTIRKGLLQSSLIAFMLSGVILHLKLNRPGTAVFLALMMAACYYGIVEILKRSPWRRLIEGS